MANFTLPQDPKLAGKVLDADAAKIRRQLDIGWMGHVFGAGSEKPGNIAGLAFVVSGLMLIGVFMWGPTGTDKTAVMGIFGSVFTGSIGYLFGRGSSSSSE